MSKTSYDDTEPLETDKEKNEMLFNPVEKEERSKKNLSKEEDEMNEFNTWTKKYNHISKEIRRNAIEQEKQELKGLEKSPLVKYYEGSRIDRIQALEQEQKVIEEMEMNKKDAKK